MITLDQVQLLEQKVESAISRINELNKEKAILIEHCDSLKIQNSELQQKLLSFQADQGRIEKGILNALDRLATVENTLLNTSIDSSIQETNQTPQETVANYDQSINEGTQQQTANTGKEEISNIPSEHITEHNDFFEPITSDINHSNFSQNQNTNHTQLFKSDNNLDTDIMTETQPTEQDLFSELQQSQQDEAQHKQLSENEFIY